MVGIQGLGGVPEPKSDRPDKVRNGREDASKNASGAGEGTRSKDDVSISAEARAASEVGRLTQLAKTENEIRADRVAAAKQRIERGDYKDPEVVAKVAQRLLKFIG